MRKLIFTGAVAGSVGGLAMVPFGLVLGRVLHYPLNVYGPLLVLAILGRVPVWALAVEHFLISWGMAVPLVALLPRLGRSRPVLVGAVYGASLWLVVNSLLLPAVFGRPTPWRLGLAAIWPSLTVHVVYGAAAALVAPRFLAWLAAGEPGRATPR